MIAVGPTFHPGCTSFAVESFELEAEQNRRGQAGVSAVLADGGQAGAIFLRGRFLHSKGEVRCFQALFLI